jgi:hypothetical protein
VFGVIKILISFSLIFIKTKKSSISFNFAVKNNRQIKKDILFIIAVNINI